MASCEITEKKRLPRKPPRRYHRRKSCPSRILFVSWCTFACSENLDNQTSDASSRNNHLKWFDDLFHDPGKRNKLHTEISNNSHLEHLQRPLMFRDSYILMWWTAGKKRRIARTPGDPVFWGGTTPLSWWLAFAKSDTATDDAMGQLEWIFRKSRLLAERK